MDMYVVYIYYVGICIYVFVNRLNIQQNGKEIRCEIRCGDLECLYVYVILLCMNHIRYIDK